MIINNIDEMIGNTPIIKLNNIKEDGEADIYAKVESFNPSGSIKDRPALYMIKDAEEKGILKKGSTIIEPTSGNMGIGLAMIGASKGYRVILVMPETMSEERKKLMKAYGAEIILTSGSEGMRGSIELAEEIANDKSYFLPNQFKNLANKKAHYETTSVEILKQMEGRLDAFVAGVGTGGTISGIGKRLKEHDRNILIVAGEPDTSRVLIGEKAGPHKIQGIGANFIPDIYDESVIDEVMSISSEDAFKYARLLGVKEGILAGVSSGGNLAAAKSLAKKLGKGKKVVTVFPDTGERYLSTDLFNGE